MKRLLPYTLQLMLLMILLPVTADGQTERERREAYLEEIISLQEQPSSDPFVSHHDATWLDWVERTGELPPDFSKMPSIPMLPDPLIIDEGGKHIEVQTEEQWLEKRAWIEEQVKHLFSGTFPEPPGNMEVDVLEKRVENGVTIELIELRFGEDGRVKITLEMFTPPGEGPFPVFMTQWNHRGWAQIAVRRGYIGLIYAGADAKDDTREYLEHYPDHDWSTLMTRAWGAHRVVDFLYTRESVDRSGIALTGHSRNGKQSPFAAAFDKRITAVITSSGGTGGEFPYRYTDDRHSNESIEYLVSRRTHWLHPRLRFFAGREHKMPIDQNSLMALIAPNSLLLSSSIREGGGGDAWAVEHMYKSLTGVYSFLNASDKLGIRLRDGEHAVEARDIEGYLDWLDIQLGRSSGTWDNTRVYDYSFREWVESSGESVNPEAWPVVEERPLLTDNSGAAIGTTEEWRARRAEIHEQINWVLGDVPPGISADPIRSLSSTRQDYISRFMSRPRVTNGAVRYIATYNDMGDYNHAALYYPTTDDGEMITGESGKLPVMIYLHRYSNTGYDMRTGMDLRRLFEELLSRGVAVLAMDMTGYGTRIEEAKPFYDRYPNWSRMGKMVEDTRAAIDALESLDFVDSRSIYLSGYALGGTVSLFTSALDSRVAGTAVSSAYTPLRTASENVECLKAWSHLHGLIPRLGFFADHPDRLPVDFPEIIASIAPRPLLVMAPELDRHADADQVEEALQEVGSVYSLYEAGDRLQVQTPREYNTFSAAQQQELLDWLDEQLESDRPSLTVDDFSFSGPFGSEGTTIEQIGENHFRVRLGSAPENPGWPNNLYLTIEQNARGNDLRLEVAFPEGTGYAFNSYFYSWSYDGVNWHPIHWRHGRQNSPVWDELIFPVFEEDRVIVGHQAPISFEQVEEMKRGWSEHPDVTLHTIGESIHGRPLYRLEITGSDSPLPESERWVHYFANQHPGEHNSQWRMAGMVDWILSDEGARFREQNIAHFVFYMSPDAPSRGWYRTNQEGVDMNRSYRAEGADKDEQTHEAYFWQQDLERLMASESPVTAIWAMHTWQGIVEPLLRTGPAMGSALGPWTDVRASLIRKHPANLVQPLVVRDGEAGYGSVSWTDGPHAQFGITAILCEGGGSFDTIETNRESGVILIKSIDEYYSQARRSDGTATTGGL